MPPKVATLVYFCGIAALFALNRDKKTRTSKVLWIPVIWILIACSRMISQWLAVFGIMSAGPGLDTPEAYLDGSPFDRVLLAALLLVCIGVLVQRSARLGRIFRANLPIIIFFAYCGLSIAWSEYPDVAFKRWFKTLGDLVMVLVVLTEANPMAAVKTLLARVSFLLIPLSILLGKYYPDIGRQYHQWDWLPVWVGVTTGKNLLGMVCLVCGISCAWRLRQAFSEIGSPNRRNRMIAHGIVLAMMVWLFWMANSMTSLSCFLMASVLIVATGIRSLRGRRRWVVHALAVAILSVSVFTLFSDSSGGMLQAMGRNPTLTGRTDIWKLVLSLSGNPLVGTGFESFWLGKRLEKMWSVYWWHINEAHNGYLEVYLSLGWIGIMLLVWMVVAGYRNIFRAFRLDPEEGTVRLAYFVIALAYNCTESAIRMMNPVWIFFLMAIIAVPGGWARNGGPAQNAAAQVQESPEPMPVEELRPLPV